MALALLLTSNSLLGAAPAPAAGPTPSTATGAREPLIEVSVDSLEISESNTALVGLLWGDAFNPGAGQINFLEESPVPSLFKVGEIQRAPLAGILDAMIKNNQVRVLANPTLLSKSGFEASFLVGGEVPYPQVGQGGVSGVEYKKYGVSVKILPQITPRETIDAQINVNVSNPDASVAIPVDRAMVSGMATREASTKVEVRDGETVVLAGIKQSRKEKVIVRVPILGYIPILGLLFRHKDEKVTQTSLVIFVTFRLVKS